MGFDALRAGYEAAGGVVRLDALHWWMVARAVWWAIGLANQAVAFTSGLTNSIVLAASGRRFAAVTGRAFLAPEALAALAGPMVAAGGRLIICGGSDPLDADDLARAAGPEFFVASADEIRLPGGTEKRQILALERDPAS